MQSDETNPNGKSQKAIPLRLASKQPYTLQGLRDDRFFDPRSDLSISLFDGPRLAAGSSRKEALMKFGVGDFLKGCYSESVKEWENVPVGAYKCIRKT
ncbi:MAG: hypothetical protein AAFV95_04015 [Bacteroidota bacterium]